MHTVTDNATLTTRTDAAAPRRVLIVKPSALGDVVTALPVLRALRRTFGRQVTVDWLVDRTCAAAIAEESDLDETVLFDRRRYGAMWRSVRAAVEFRSFCRDLRARRYDWVIDLQGLFRSGFLSFVTGARVRAGFAAARELAWLFYTHKLPAADMPPHTVDRNIALARRLGLDARSDDFTLTVPPSAGPWLKSFVDEHGPDFILAAPATRWATKLYPTEHWHAVIESLAARMPVVLVAGPGEKHLTAPLADIPNTLDLAGATTIAQLIALISAARCVISCDSAAMNMAAALDRPQVTLIGPTDPTRTGPYRREDAVIVSPMECAGCLRRRCSRGGCMKAIAPAAVIEAVEARL